MLYFSWVELEALLTPTLKSWAFADISLCAQGLPDSWTRLLSSSAITREDYQRNPQAVIEALGFYTEHQKQAFEEQGMTSAPMSLSASNVRPTYAPEVITTAPPRFGAGTGFAGASGGRDSPSMSQTSPISRDIDGTPPGRPSLSRIESSPPGLDSGPGTRGYSGSRPTDYSNGATSVRGPPGIQASRPAPPRPAPPSTSQKSQSPKQAASSAALAERARQQQERQTRSDDETRPNQRIPRAEKDERPLDGTGQPLPTRNDSVAKQQQAAAQQRERDDRARQRELEKARERELRERVERDLEQRERERELREQQQRPPLQTPARSMTANTTPATDPAPGAAGALTGPPPVKPLQTAKKLPPLDGGVAAAAAALEKPKTVEKRISTMSEAQIMDKLRSVVSPDDPKALYTTIKKVGQG